MEHKSKLFLYIAMLILLFFVEKGVSIKCWQCRSDYDPKCSDPFDNSTGTVADCNTHNPPEHLEGIGKPTMCRKIRQKVNGQWRYFRGCAYLGEPGIGGDERFCLMRTGTYNIFIEYCTCNSKDGCNTASGTQQSKILLLGCTILLISLTRFFRT